MIQRPFLKKTMLSFFSDVPKGDSLYAANGTWNALVANETNKAV